VVIGTGTEGQHKATNSTLQEMWRYFLPQKWWLALKWLHQVTCGLHIYS